MNNDQGPYFDLHLHASLKHFLTENKKGKRRSIWKKITHWTSPIAKMAPILKSQGCLSQLADGNVQMAVVGICPLELPLAKFVQQNRFVTWITPLAKGVLNSIVNREQGHSYFQLMQKELKFILKECESGNAKVMSRINEMEEGKVNLLLSIEGGHALIGEGNDSIIHNLLEVKKSPHRFLYLTLTHLTQNPLANHAFALKKVLGQSLNDPAFKPNGNGLTELGKNVIQLAYDSTKGKQVLIDIKHMSLKSRLEFYRFREEMGYADVPIIASHMAMAGFAHKDFPSRVDAFSSEVKDEKVVVHYKPDSLQHTTFNPWSINLYDEEIPHIINSGGLIGLCMDERILGRTKLEPEYFCKEEFESIHPRLLDKICESKGPRVAHSVARSEKRNGNDNKNLHIKYLCNNILRMVKAGGPETWKYICLGSDFDGFISPIHGVKSTLEYKSLESGKNPDPRKNEMTISIMLQKMAYEDPELGFIPDMQQKVRDIMYNNAYRFLQRYLVH